MTTKKTKQEIAVVVTTEKGVFFGYTDSPEARSVVLNKARMCIMWTSDVKGVLGLAATGPSKSCRVGPQVIKVRIPDVTSVTDASPEAVSKWESAPWG